MNFNEEMEIELAEFGTGKLEVTPEDERATVEDWRNLEKRIELCVRENEAMMSQSELNAARSALC